MARVLMIVAVLLAGCTSNPQAPINQTAPIREMDGFFRSLDNPPSSQDPLDYTHQPGYAPAYPPY